MVPDALAWVDGEEFDSLCQRYRHVNQHHYEGEAETVKAFENLKAYIRSNCVYAMERERNGGGS